MEEAKQPIVIKKINAGHAHHGGSWKVAFADFATAMMAFFLLLWLVGQTTAEKRGGIAEWFQNPSMVKGHSEAPTGALGPGGASTSLINMGGMMDPPKDPVQAENQDPRNASGKEDEGNKDNKSAENNKDDNGSNQGNDDGTGREGKERAEDMQRLGALLARLQKAVGKSQALKPFKDQLLMHITPEGLRIQIVDKANRPMFASGSSELKHYSLDVLYELAGLINSVPNKISISGHTDATPFSKGAYYSNWELSSDRANAARRTLVQGGMRRSKISHVIGLADSTLLDPKSPRNPINRRISIVVMTRAKERAISIGEGAELPKLSKALKALKPPAKQAAPKHAKSKEAKPKNAKQAEPAAQQPAAQSAAETQTPAKQDKAAAKKAKQAKQAKTEQNANQGGAKRGRIRNIIDPDLMPKPRTRSQKNARPR